MPFYQSLGNVPRPSCSAKSQTRRPADSSDGASVANSVDLPEP